MRIVYQSFEGRYSDSPRALYEALRRDDGDDHEHLWLADPRHRAGFPPGAQTALYGSEESVAALEAADLVVANTHTDLRWTKRPGATYLQTWHGTPLKRVHWDVLWAPQGRLERLSRDVEQWDLLLSQNPHSTRALRRAFRFQGEVLETGYPRNDVLSAPDARERREAVRRELGLPPDVTAVLYTPTWRDDFVFAGGDADVELHLDPGAFARELGRDHVLLLRLHYMLTGRLAAIASPAVRDVSMHPDVSDLYLAADVLVTDYSSTMFDFAVTGRPIVLYAYDLDHYRDHQRGFYVDLEAEAPGPVVRTSDALLDALRHLGALRRRHADRYERFRRRYVALEDGRASQRVLERLGLSAGPAAPAGR